MKKPTICQRCKEKKDIYYLNGILKKTGDYDVGYYYKKYETPPEKLSVRKKEIYKEFTDLYFKMYGVKPQEQQLRPNESCYKNLMEYKVLCYECYRQESRKMSKRVNFFGRIKNKRIIYTPTKRINCSCGYSFDTYAENETHCCKCHKSHIINKEKHNLKQRKEREYYKQKKIKLIEKTPELKQKNLKESVNILFPHFSKQVKKAVIMDGLVLNKLMVKRGIIKNEVDKNDI